MISVQNSVDSNSILNLLWDTTPYSNSCQCQFGKGMTCTPYISKIKPKPKADLLVLTKKSGRKCVDMGVKRAEIKNRSIKSVRGKREESDKILFFFQSQKAKKAKIA